MLCADSAASVLCRVCWYLPLLCLSHLSWCRLLMGLVSFLFEELSWMIVWGGSTGNVCVFGWLFVVGFLFFVLQYSGWSQKPTLLQLCTHSSECLYFTFILKRYFSWIQNSVLTTAFFWHFRKCLCIFLLAAMVSVEKATAFASLFPIRNLSVSLVVLSFLSLSFGWFQCLLALSGCEFLLFILLGICWASAPVRIEAWGDSTEI